MQIGNTNSQGFPPLIIHQYVIGCRQTFGPCSLHRHDRANFFFGKATTRNNPFNLRGFRAIDHQNAINELAVAFILDK